MKKNLQILQKLFWIIFPTIIVWFILYFSIGERFSIYFTDRTFASYFPYILVFSTAVSIYGIFILLIHSQRKKWINILLFTSGLLFASLPFLIYHGYFQHQCHFWNQKITESQPLFVSKIDDSEKISEIKIECITEQKEQTKIVFLKEFTPFFNWIQEIDIQNLDNFWKKVE
ncbi:MAG: hypothetical protein RBT46_05555 [Weeksellaceae bacterium]|jgi:hypothetical protein|nr:hypothetical protein [Weeksellaceae bacterium]